MFSLVGGLTMRDELAFALELADEADAIALRYFSERPETFTKDDGTLVTKADREIEATLREQIRRRYPDHLVLGEESGLGAGPGPGGMGGVGSGGANGAGEPGGSSGVGGGGSGAGGGFRWVIDPIDGTNNFAWGIPIFATLIALQLDGAPDVGVVSAPALRERYDAARGEGARCNGQPIHVSDVASLAESRYVFATWEEWIEAGLDQQWGALLDGGRRSRGFGDFWGHMLVARGAAEAMAEPELELWDVAAVEAVVLEAGGQLTDFAGKPFRGRGSCLTSNGLVHEGVLRALNAPPTQ
ncbi:MAG: inositol monophosphatase family protein [Actinomycetota bacterium]